MTAYRASAVWLVVLTALVGCKKKPAGTGDAAPAGDPNGRIEPATPGGPVAILPSPTAGKVTAWLDRMADDIEHDKVSGFEARLDSQLPAPVAGVSAVDATAVRPALDASFARFWAAWETRPERTRQKNVLDLTDTLTKQGMPPDKAKERAEQSIRPLPPLQVTTPNPDFAGKFFNHIEANVPDGVTGDWTAPTLTRVAGAVRFSASLRVGSNGGVTLKLRGQVGTLTVDPVVDVFADLLELDAPVVELRAKGTTFLRVGPKTKTVRLLGNVINATVFAPAKSGLKLEGAEATHRGVVVVWY